MPASKISAPVGSRLKVMGKSIAMVAIGPIPGSTPISVPIRHPPRHKSTFSSESEVAKPSCRF
jgi:hypothetical protein